MIFEITCFICYICYKDNKASRKEAQMTLTRYERETVINFNEEEDTATVYTCNKPLIRKLNSFCSKSTLFNVKRGDEYSREYKIPKRCISIRFPMQISVEKRAERANRAKALSGNKGTKAEGQKICQ